MARIRSVNLNRTLDRTGVAVLAGSVLLLLALAGASIWLARRTAEATQAQAAIQRSTGFAVSALLVLEGAETGQRGFLLTGQEQYLHVYEDAVRMAPDALHTLSEVDAEPGVDPGRMQVILQSKLAELGRTVELEQQGRHADALAVVRTNVGQSLMDEYRRLSDRLINAQNARQNRLFERIDADTRILVWLDGLGVLVVLGLTGLLAVGVNRTMGALRGARRATEAANAALAGANAGLEEAVAKRTAELTLANEEIQRFAYIVSHDLRSPLVNIMGFTSELESAQAVIDAHMKDADPPPAMREAVREDLPESIRFIRTSTAKMDRLIGAILRISREGRRRLMPEELDMSALLRSAADTLAHPAQDAGAEIVIKDVPNLRSDRISVEQVFSNLLENALKYRQPGRPPRIRVSGARHGDAVRYEVEDNGRGIAQRDLQRVFDLFRRAGDQDVPGEGIGLAHVRALVRRLGGSITCRSELGVGTSFTIELPVLAAQQRDLAA